MPDLTKPLAELAQSTAEELRHCVDDFGDDGWGFNVAMAQDCLLRAFAAVRAQLDEAIGALQRERQFALDEWGKAAKFADAANAQLAALDAFKAEVRNLALEEAADLCDGAQIEFSPNWNATVCNMADRIRALKTGGSK